MDGAAALQALKTHQRVAAVVWAHVFTSPETLHTPTQNTSLKDIIDVFWADSKLFSIYFFSDIHTGDFFRYNSTAAATMTTTDHTYGE